MHTVMHVFSTILSTEETNSCEFDGKIFVIKRDFDCSFKGRLVNHVNFSLYYYFYPFPYTS